MLSDHAFHFLGRTITISRSEQFVVAVVLVILATAWVVLQFRRRGSIVIQRSGVSDQLVYELTRIADALERIANRPADQLLAAASGNQPEEPGRVSLSMFGR